MASMYPLRVLLLIQLIQVCSAQYYYSNYYYNYNNYNYGDYGNDNSWCPFGINGICTCENDIVDCTSQGLSEVPQDLPSTTKQLILKDNRISTIDFMPLISYTSLEFLDISSNNISTLPYGVLEYLSALRTLDLSNNPWECDCNLKWLTIWRHTVAASSNVQFIGASSTNCVAWPSVPMLDLLPADFLPCAVPVRVLRSVNSASPSAIQTFSNWTSVCYYWFPQPDCKAGPSEAGSCVLSPDTHDVAVVQYSSFTTQTDADACRDYCFANHFTYHAFQNSTFHCLCGLEDPSSTSQCTDCSSSTVSSTVVTLCWYMRIPDPSHVLSSVAIAFTSPVVTHIPVTFTLSNFPDVVSSLSWDFGDGAKRNNATVATVSHTYFYPGSFPLRVELCGSRVCRTVQIVVKVDSPNMQADLTCPVLSNISSKISLNTSVSNSYGSTVRWSRTSSDGTLYAGGCRHGWLAFNNRCIKYVTSSKTFSQAETACGNRNGTLLRVNHVSEHQDLPSLLSLSATTTTWIGARHNGTVYKWEATSEPAYFLRALSIDRSAGDCLVLSSSGLAAADCSSLHYVLCQQDPVACPVGQQLGTSGHCYYLESSGQSWEQARQTCQSMYSGDLATLPVQSTNALITSSLGVGSLTWMGLSAADLLGHYTWVDGESLTWTNWASNILQTGVQWPCVGVQATGQWEPAACEQTLPFICEYSLTETVMSDLHVAGSADLQSNSSYQSVTEYTQSRPQHAGMTMVMPGVWFAKEGQLLEINFQVETQQTDNIVAVQVLRPSCSSGQVVVRPGCSQNMFAKCGSQAEASSCASLANCSSDSQHVCPLSNSCIASSSPCSCAANTATNIDCSATTPDSSMSYTVVGEAAYEIPAGGGSFTAEIPDGIQVQTNDILAFQSMAPDFGFCEVDLSSQWQQVAFIRVGNNWNSVNSQVSLASYNKQENYVCRLGVLYGQPKTVILPDNLAYVPSALSYTFVAEVVGSATATESCLVETFQEVGDLVWLHPALSPSATVPTVYLEAGVLQELVAMVPSGSHLQVTWESSTGGARTGSTVSSCPSSVPVTVSECFNPTSQLAQPFVVFSNTFSSSGSVTLSLNVSNSWQWKSLQVDVHGEEPIQNLVLYHSSCSSSTACGPFVEVGATQQFLTSKSSGTVDAYEFKINGTVLQSGQMSNLSHTFTQPGLYVITVYASNGLNSMDATLNVDARVKAEVTNLSLEPPSPMYVKESENASFTMRASVAVLAELNITWDFGDGNPESVVIQTSSASLNLYKEHRYSSAGTYSLKVSVVDAFGVEVNETAVINVLSVVEQLSVSVVPLTVAAGNSTTVSVSVVSLSSSNPHFGRLTYSFNFGDGSGNKVQSGTQTSKSMSHAYSSNGTYTVRIKARNSVGSLTTRTLVYVQSCPTGVQLSYDGPKNMSDQLTFMAVPTQGSDLQYIFEFGDGSSAATQSYPIAQHTYNASNTYTATVHAGNDVCSVSDSETVIVMDSTTLVIRKINHTEYTAVGQFTVFDLDLVTLDMQKVDLVWSVVLAKGSTFSLPLRATTTFYFAFPSVNNYTVSVVVTLDNGVSGSASTIISVQEEVTSVTMVAPNLVSYTQNQPAILTFQASAANGTDVDFRWSENGVVIAAQGPNITLQMSTAGVHNISVVAFNEVSEAETWSLVTVQQIIENVAITCRSCINSKFSATQTQAEFEVTFHGNAETITWNTGATVGNGSVFSHVYTVAGPHVVEVIVTNLVSMENVSLEVVVEEEVSSIALTADHPVTSEGSSVHLSAVHSQGTDVEYTWQCGSQPSYQTSVNSTSVVFNTWGLHTCNISATNNVSSQHASMDIRVLQTITSLGIKNWNASGTLYVPTNKQPGVEAECNTNFGVNFTWHVMKAGAVLNTGDGGVLTYTFPTVGQYELRLKAQNAISSLNISVPVEALEEITNLQLTANATNVVVGDGIELTADIATGTNAEIEWAVNSMPLSSVRGFMSFPYTFTSAGSFVIEVIVSNVLNTQTDNVTILVQYPIQNIYFSTSMDISHPYVAQNQQFDFQANVSQGSSPVYQWTVQPPTVQHIVTGSLLSQTFNETGTYNILVIVSNAVSQENQTFSVYVERAITSLNMTVNPSTISATGDVVTFQGQPNADAVPVDYTWTVDGQTFSTPMLTHTFNAAGFYGIKLLAHNNISWLEARETLEVQDPVTGLLMSDCNVTRQVGVSSTLSATAQGTNVSFSWIIQLPTQNRTSLGPILTLTFPVEGIYPVHLLAGNKVKQETLTCHVKVQNAIANVAVSIDNPPVNYIFTNQNVTFVVTGDYLTNASYIWNFVGINTDQTNISTYTTTFTTAQQVTLELTVMNDISQEVVSINFTVQDLQCNLPVVTPVGSGTQQVLRSKTTQFDVYIDYRGCTQYTVTHSWRIYDVSDCSQALPPSSLSLSSVDMANPTLILPVGLLPASTQSFCVHYTLGYSNTPVAEEVFYNLTVSSTPLVAVIAGGGWRQVDGLGQVCLDGGLSYNPDSPNSGSTGMMFAWQCQVVSGSGSCFQPVTNTSSTLCVPSMSMGSFNITLTVFLTGSANIPHSTSQMLEVWVSTPSILPVGVECVSCQATRTYGISSSHHTVLSSSCEGCPADVTYTWTVTDDTGTTVSLGAADTSTGTTGSNLVVLHSNSVLQDGHAYTFMVTVNSASGSRSPGKAYVTLQPNLPPSGGICTATPDKVIVLQELVTVTCGNWVDSDSVDSELWYEIKVIQDTQSYLLYYGVRETQAVYVAPLPGFGNIATLVVSVLDDSGARTEALRKDIEFSTTGMQANNLTAELYQSANTTLTTLIQQGDPVPLLQYAIALTLMLNSASTGSLQTDDVNVQTMIRTAITVCVSSNVPVETMQQVQQMAYLLKQLTEYSAEYQNSGCQTLALQSLQNIVTLLQSSVRLGLDRDDFAYSSLFSTIYNLMQAASLASSTSSSTSTVSFSNTFPQFTSLSGTSTQALDFSTGSVTADHKKNIVSEAFTLAGDVASIVLQSVVLGESSITFQLGDMTLEGSRTTVGTVGSYFEESGCRFMLPGSMFGGLSSDEEILKILIMMNSNPYTWGYIDNHEVTTRVPTLSFKYPDGSDLPVTGLATSIELIMFDNDNNNYTITNSSLIQSPHYDPLASTSFETWTLEGGKSKKLLIDAETGTSSISALHVMVRVEAVPNATDLVNGVTPTATIKAYLGAGYEASSDQYTDYKEITTANMATGVDHRLYTFYVSPDQFNDGTEYSVTLVNEDGGHSVNISSSMYVSSCQYYEESSRVWSASGCTVSEQSIPMATVCLCNHLTAFGGSSLVPISSISFSDLAKLELGLNPVSLVAICTILLIYIVGVIICRHLDRADLRRISLVPLCGRDGAFRYHITVVTGRHIGAGTSAHIGIKLYGGNGKSEARHLTKSAAFQRNSRDTFLIASDNDLGRLHKVRVWHDNTGSSPSWYLTQIQVQDLQSGQRYVFPANSWLSLEQEDGVLQKELCVADHAELHSFSNVFSTSLANSMAERHMWLSVFNRPDHSRFTRVQRFTCCITLVYLYMFMNAMWYGLIKDESETTNKISWNMIDWEEIIIAVVSAAAIFPVALILICIFKRSRSKADVFKQAMRPQSAQTLEIDAMCDVSQYGGSLRTMTPNEDWSTIFERESTTESIPNSPRILWSPRTPCTPRTPRSRSLRSPLSTALEPEEPISSQLRRTTAVTRSSKDSQFGHATFPGSGKRSAVQVIRRTQELMWNQENILKSWPEKLPSFAEEERETQSTDAPSASSAGVTASASTSASTAGASDSTPGTSSTSRTGSVKISGTSARKINKTASMSSKPSTVPVLKKTKSAPGKPEGQFTRAKAAPQPSTSGVVPSKTASFKKEAENSSDDHEEFMQRLDQIDRELKKSASIRSKASMKNGKGLVKKHSSHSSHSAIDDLFESDDEWASEGLEGKGGRKLEGSTSNPRQEPGLDRRASVTSLMLLRAASMHIPSSAGSSFPRRDSTFMRRDSTFNSFMISEKSRTTLSAMLKNRMQLLGSPVEEGGCRLPWFCVYVGYAICLVLSILSILMVMLYGYNFGSDIALQWLLAVILAFLCSIFVLEPLKVVILSLYVAMIVKDAEKDVEADSIDVMPSIEANEQLKEVKFRPLGGFALLQAHKEGRKIHRLRTMFRQTVAYVLLTTMALVVGNLYFGPLLFRFRGHMENSFIYTDTSSGSVDFYNINSTDVFWDWSKDVLTPALFRRSLVANEDNPLLLGPARLRQIRSTMVDCLTNKTEETRSCIGRLDFSEDTAAYSPGWLSSATSNMSWVYSSAEQLNVWPKFGQDILYTGGGYVQELGTTYNQTLDKLKDIDDAGWLDRSTRALFVEWTSYSAPEDMFSAVTLLLEFPISGGVLASHTIRTQRLYIFNPDKVEPLHVCQVLMLLPAIYLLINSMSTLCEQKCQFLQSAGNWLQVLSILLCLASIGLYITCVVQATDTAKGFRDHWASFTNFEHVVHLHDILRLLHACLLFLLFLKIAGQVRFIRPISVYPRTLATAFGRLCAATLVFLIVLLVYTQLGYLLYGSFLHGYRSIQNSLGTLFNVMKGVEDLSSPLEQHRILSHFFFYSFYTFVYGLFVALVIAILQDAYKLTRSQMFFKSSLEPQDYEMIDFMLKRFKLWAGIIKPKPAFRRVQFEGQPSLPSRGSSSATSSWRSPSQNSMERHTPTPDLIASTSNADALDRLLPAWERLLALVGTMEILEKEEQRQIDNMENAFDHWGIEQDKKSTSPTAKKKSLSGETTRKPPVDVKSKFSKFRLNFQNSEQSVASQRQSFTPPPLSSSDRADGINQAMQRTFSDQGGTSFEIPARPSSDSQRMRPFPGVATSTTAAPAEQGGSIKDTFPGSASQRSRAPPSIKGKGLSRGSKMGPGIMVRQPATLSGSSGTGEDSKKKAWEG